MNYLVYKHTCPNNKVYIGITKLDPLVRWGKNGSNYRGQVFYYAILKYGWDNIKHEILYTDLSRNEAEHKEVELIAEYKSNHKEYGYNVDNGGNYGGSRSKETREKISQSLKRTLNTEEGREIHSKASVGRKRSEEWRRMMSEIHSGKTVSQETREKIGNANKGHKHSEETKKQIGRTLCIPIICVETGVVYFGTRDDESKTGINGTSINKCIKKKLKKAGGYHWAYYGDDIPQTF